MIGRRSQALPAGRTATILAFAIGCAVALAGGSREAIWTYRPHAREGRWLVFARGGR